MNPPNGGIFFSNMQRASNIYLFIGLITVFSCAPDDDKQSVVPNLKDTTINNPQAAPQASVNQLDQPEFPFLNQQNHEKFLRKYWKENHERFVRLSTVFGEIKIELFEETPLHSANFLMLTKRNYFEGTLFSRVVPGFIIQGGGSDREELMLERMVIGSYLIKPEFNAELIHQRGMLSMARSYENNPEKKSSEYDFFIVVGQTFNEPQLMSIERDHDKTFRELHRKIYRETGGAPHLDGEHTVFGRVVSGMDVVDKISRVETDSRDWPKEDILIIKSEALLKP